MTEIEQLRIDLMYLARRQKALELAIEDWTEFMASELLRQGIQINKYKKSNEYFKQSLKDKFKADYDKFEALFLKVKRPSKKGIKYTIRPEPGGVGRGYSK